jgi:hypothetical protein
VTATDASDPVDDSDDDSDQSDRVRKVVLETDVAHEVIELIDDRPGEADEDALDAALEALRSAEERVPPDDQRKAAQGRVVAIELDPDSASAVETLITDDVATRTQALRRVRDRLRGKLRRARRRRKG